VSRAIKHRLQHGWVTVKRIGHVDRYSLIDVPKLADDSRQVTR
jgi:hypothetical protein